MTTIQPIVFERKTVRRKKERLSNMKRTVKKNRLRSMKRQVTDSLQFPQKQNFKRRLDGCNPIKGLQKNFNKRRKYKHR